MLTTEEMDATSDHLEAEYDGAKFQKTSGDRFCPKCRRFWTPMFVEAEGWETATCPDCKKRDLLWLR